MSAIFPLNLIMQEMSPENRIDIPEEVRDIYTLWRPTPLLRAVRFEKALDTPAHIYYKYEGVSPGGSHKLNTAVPQAYYNKQAGTQHYRHRDRRGAMGFLPGPGLQAFRTRLQGLHGAGQLPPETLPQVDDANLGRQGISLSQP